MSNQLESEFEAVLSSILCLSERALTEKQRIKYHNALSYVKVGKKIIEELNADLKV